MKKFISILVIVMLLMSVFTCTMADEVPTGVLREEETVAYLENETGVRVLFAEYSVDDTLVLIGNRFGRLPHTEHFDYEAVEVVRFRDAFIEGDLEELDEVTGCLNVLLTEDEYGIDDILRLLEVKECLPLPIPGEPYYVPFMGVRFEVWPDADFEIMREEFVLQAYFMDIP